MIAEQKFLPDLILVGAYLPEHPQRVESRQRNDHQQTAKTHGERKPCAQNQPIEPGSKTHLAFAEQDRKSTRLNSSHGYISYAVFCLKKKKKKKTDIQQPHD